VIFIRNCEIIHGSCEIYSYLSDEDLLDNFVQLVGGVIWLVRNEEPYVDVSKVVECPDTQTTGWCMLHLFQFVFNVLISELLQL